MCEEHQWQGIYSFRTCITLYSMTAQLFGLRRLLSSVQAEQIQAGRAVSTDQKPTHITISLQCHSNNNSKHTLGYLCTHWYLFTHSSLHISYNYIIKLVNLCLFMLYHSYTEHTMTPLCIMCQQQPFLLSYMVLTEVYCGKLNGHF